MSKLEALRIVILEGRRALWINRGKRSVDFKALVAASEALGLNDTEFLAIEKEFGYVKKDGTRIFAHLKEIKP